MRAIIVLLVTALAFSACAQSRGTIPGDATVGDTALRPDAGESTSILKKLKSQSTVGSTVDTANGDKHPLGLSLPEFSRGNIKAGDVYVCNYADKSGTLGSGTTIEAVTPGSATAEPVRFAQSPSLLGCAGFAIDGNDTAWVAASGTKAEVTLSPAGAPQKIYSKGYSRPFGTTFVSTGQLYGSHYVFVSDVATGAITLAEACAPSAPCTYPNVQIVVGFPVRSAKQGALGPVGLAYDPAASEPQCMGCGALYVADSADNTVVEIFDAALLNKAKSIVVGANGKTFSGPDAKYAKVFHTGLPLSMPGGVTMLYEQVVSGAPTAPGNLVVANSAGKNELVEFSPAGKPLDRLVVDKGAPGALFGMQAIGSGAATKLYLTDSNSNTIQVLQK